MTQYSDMPEGATVVSTPQAQTPPQNSQPAQPQQYSDLPQGATLAAPPKVSAPPVDANASPKAGLDIGTVGSAVAGAGEGLYGLAKGAVELPAKAAAYQIAGTPHEDVQKQLADAAEANKHAVYHKFADDFRKGSYSDAFKGLADLFKDEGADPNDPVHQFLEQQWQLSQQAKANAVEAGKKGDIAGVLQHSVGVVPIASAVDAAMTEFQKNPTRANLKEVIANAVPAFVPLMNRGVGKLSDAAKGAIRDKVRASSTPTTETSPMGAQIPVRSETGLGKAVAAGAPEKTVEFAQTRTAPAVQKAVGGAIGEAIGSEATTTLAPEDRMGVKGHANNLMKDQAGPAYKAMDTLSEDDAAKNPVPSWEEYVQQNKGVPRSKMSADYQTLKNENMTFSEIQEKMDNSRADFSKEGRAEFNEAKEQKAAMIDKYRETLASQGHDIDAADAAWGKGKEAQKMAAKLDTATGPSNVEGAPYELNGKRLMKVIDDGVKNGAWKKMGLTDEHINELQSLAKTAAKQTTLESTKWMTNMGKLAIMASGLHGGILAAAEAVSGVSAADYVGGKISKHIMQDAMMNYDTTRAMNESLKSGNAQPVVEALSKDPSWVARTKAFVQDIIDKRPFRGGGETGAVGANVKVRKAGGNWPSTDDLIKKYGEADDPSHVAFLSPEGRGVAHAGVEHDVMLGGTPKDDLRTPFINETGHIRMRAHGTYGGRQFNISVPESGITPAQLDKLKAWEPQIRTGSQYIEVAKPDGKYITLQRGTGQSTEAALRSLVPIKGEVSPEAHPFAEMRAEHLDKGGATFDKNGKNLAGTDAWSVGVHPDLTEPVTDKEFTPSRIAQFAEKNKGLLSREDHAIGSWRDPDTKQNVLDVVKLIKDDDAAKAAGAGANQKAIYHLKRGELADTGGTGEGRALNASGESAASLEAQARLKSQQAKGLRTYDVDSRKSGSKDAWHPVMAISDAIDQKASPFHHLVQVDAEGRSTILDSGEGARPLPSNEHIQSLIGQAAGKAPVTPARPVDMSGSEIATRYPNSATAVTSNNPANLSGLDALNEADRQSPTRMTQAGKPVLGVKQKLAAALADYKDNGVSNLLDAADPDAAIEKYVSHVKENLKWLHNSMPESIRKAARGWYETAHNVTKDIAQKNGITHEQSAAVTAALSPKNDWNNNVGQAKRLIEHYANDQNHAWTDKMDQAVSDIRNNGAVNDQFKRMLSDIRGKKLNELKAKTPEALLAKKALWYRVLDEAHGSKDTPIYSPDGSISGSQTMNWGQVDPIAKALSILEDGSVENIHSVMGEGHKIRNFYNNIINPFSERGHTTIDTHAVGAGLLKPLSQDDVEVAHNFGSGNKAGTPSPAKHAATGVKGSYSVHEEAYRRAAKELGLQPRELQSITWEGIRSLMGDEKKTPELRRAVSEIWRAHENGHFTLAEAREKILEHSGGFTKPNWMSDEQWEANPTEQGDTSFGGQ